MVDAIQEAAARVLVREGYARASTNRIAAVAGVSVGSLYQYFPGKEAIFAALEEAHGSEMALALTVVVEAHRGAPVSRLLRAAVDAACDTHAREVRLQRALESEVPRLGGTPRLRRLERKAMGQWEAELVARGFRDASGRLFLLSRTLDALVHAALLEAPERLGQEAFRRDLVRILEACLG